MPMPRLVHSPDISRSLRTSCPNQSVVKHSHGTTRGKAEELNAVTTMMTSGPNRNAKNSRA